MSSNEISMDTPIELARAMHEQSLEVQRLAKIVAEYEINFKIKEKLYKRALGEAVFNLRHDGMAPSLAKMAAENDEAVKLAQDELQAAEALLIMGKAEFDGVVALFQAAKKRAELMREEVRAFRG